MLIDPHGRIIASLDALQKGVVSGELGFTDSHTLYTYIGDMIWWIAFILYAPFTRKKKTNFNTL